MGKSFLVSALLLLATVTAGAVWFVPRQKNSPSEQKPAETATPSVARRVFANGQVEGRGRDIELRFENSGRLASIHVREGDRVTAGHILASLDTILLQHELAKVQARLEQAMAERERLMNGARRETRDAAQAEVRVSAAHLEQAQAVFERAAQVVNSRAVSARERDDARTEFDAAKAAHEAAVAKAAEIEAPPRPDEVRIADAKIALATAECQAARAALERADLLAPAEGRILRIACEPGEMVGPLSLEPAVIMADASEVRVRAYVEEYDAMVIAPGMTATVTADGLPQVEFRGKVTECSPYMAPKTLVRNRPDERVDVKVREIVIVLDPKDELTSLVVGLPVEVLMEAPTQQSEESQFARHEAAER